MVVSMALFRSFYTVTSMHGSKAMQLVSDLVSTGQRKSVMNIVGAMRSNKIPETVQNVEIDLGGKVSVRELSEKFKLNP